MQAGLWLIPILPLAGFAVLIIAGMKLPRALVSVIGVGSVAASFVVTAISGMALLAMPEGGAIEQTLYRWMSIALGERSYGLGLSVVLDPLSLVMCVVVTFVGSLILLYSTRYMRDDEGYSRFFAFMNLFVASMLVLVLGSNLVLLYLGWEGVGLCSYLLIGFWFREEKNARAAFKAFLVTRVGDAAMLVGLLLLFTHLGTLDIGPLMAKAAETWPVGSGLAVTAAALLLAGAVGKSAQLPLQTWLPDAMAGPTPVSALIHAATMVTAGVYLIARMHVLFTLAPTVLWLVGVIGAVSLLLAACSALVQHDIKRVLAYSTMSQIGYMFLALGVGAWSAAIFHLFTHAFFKSLLFLGAGLVIMSLHEEQNLFKMGGLRTRLPLAFWSLLIGAASLSAVPFVTAGFYSKDAILGAAWEGGQGWLWLAGLIGAVLTAIYSFRLIFLAFFGEQKHEVAPVRHPAVGVALTVLSAFAIGAGWLSAMVVPFLSGTFGEPHGEGHGEPFVIALVPVLASAIGIVIAALLYLRPLPGLAQVGETPAIRAIHRFWLGGWGFDTLYDRLFVRPYVAVARLNRSDFLDLIPQILAFISVGAHVLIVLSQTGRVRHYAVGVAVGVIILLAVVMTR